VSTGSKRQVGIAKNVRAIEWLKAELAGQMGALLRSLLAGREEDILDAMASLIVVVYVMANRLGLGFARLDTKVEQHLLANVRNQHQLETWYGDLSALRTHRRKDKGA